MGQVELPRFLFGIRLSKEAPKPQHHTQEIDFECIKQPASRRLTGLVKEGRVTLARLIKVQFQAIVVPAIFPRPFNVGQHVVDPRDERVLDERPVFPRAELLLPALQEGQKHRPFIQTVDHIIPLDPIKQVGHIDENPVDGLGKFGRHDGGVRGKRSRDGSSRLLIHQLHPVSGRTSTPPLDNGPGFSVRFHRL